MSMIEAEFHPDTILLLPELAITHGHCASEVCQDNHWRVTIGWIVGSIHFYF